MADLKAKPGLAVTVRLRKFAPIKSISETRKAQAKAIGELQNVFLSAVGVWYVTLPIRLVKTATPLLLPKDPKGLALNSLLHTQVIAYGGQLIETEFQTMLVDLMVGAYDGARRSLRRMLEIAMLVADYHISSEAKLNEILKTLKGFPKGSRDQVFFASTVFNERLRFRTKYSKPTIPELAALLGTEYVRRSLPKLPILARDLYRELSESVHLSPTTQSKIDFAWIEHMSTVVGIAESPLKYNETRFHLLSEEAFKVVDVLGCIFALALSCYLNLEPDMLVADCREALGSPAFYQDEQVHLKSKAPNLLTLLAFP